MSGETSFETERRQFPRAMLELPASIVRRSASADHPKRVVGLRILDVSRGGVGAIAQEALREEEPVTVLFPPIGARKGIDTPGQVVQCCEHEDRFRVGIRFHDPWPEHEARGMG